MSSRNFLVHWLCLDSKHDVLLCAVSPTTASKSTARRTTRRCVYLFAHLNGHCELRVLYCLPRTLVASYGTSSGYGRAAQEKPTAWLHGPVLPKPSVQRGAFVVVFPAFRASPTLVGPGPRRRRAGRRHRRGMCARASSGRGISFAARMSLARTAQIC